MVDIMMTKFKNLYIYALFAIIISLCAMYSLGIFNFYFLKSVIEKNYNSGEFLYTGDLLYGKFQNNGIIKLNDGSIYSGNFKNGGLFENFTYHSHNNWSVDGIFENGNLIQLNLKTNQYKASANQKNGWRMN